MAEVTPNYSGSPQVFSGARARFKIKDQIMGYAGGVSGEESIDYQEVELLNLLEVAEHVPVAYRVSLSARAFRVLGNSLKNLGLFPKMSSIVTAQGMTALVENASQVPNQSQPWLSQFLGVRVAGHSFDTEARNLVQENINFVAIKMLDESQTGEA